MVGLFPEPVDPDPGAAPDPVTVVTGPLPPLEAESLPELLWAETTPMAIAMTTTATLPPMRSRVREFMFTLPVRHLARILECRPGPDKRS